jgi:2-beta-glucuronyltransferase
MSIEALQAQREGSDGGGRASAFLFTQQTIGLGGRKTSMVFLAEALARRGYQVHVVTTQLSWLTRLRRGNHPAMRGDVRRNRWYDADGMRGFLWVPPVHPVGVSGRLRQWLAAPLVAAYGALLPRAVVRPLRHAQLVVIESCAAVALFRRVRRVARDARILYSMNDRLTVIGMHPGLEHRLRADAARYDLVRVPAAALLGDLPDARAALVRHGIDRRAFDAESRSPYPTGPNAVLIGDMMLDQPLLERLVKSFPEVRFHYFGRTALNFAAPANLTAWGEQPFEGVVPFVQHADVGLALYRREPGLAYLAESSLKNLQYRYCGLPVVGPDFAVATVPRALAYDPEQPVSAERALRAALARGRGARGGVADWDEVAGELLALVGAVRRRD